MARAKKPAAKAKAKKAPAKAKPTAKKAAPVKKAAPKKAVKKASAKKAAPKAAPKKIVKKAAPKKVVKKAAPKKTASKPSAAKKVAKKPAAKKAAPKKKTSAKKAASKISTAELFAPLTEGERAESLRLLLEDNRLASMAKVGRYRVIAIEPLALKASHSHGGRRLARVVIYDYAADRCVEANVDLDDYSVQHLSINQSQPMLAAEEEVAAMEIAVSDERVRQELALGEGPQAAMHYWSQHETELSHSRRTAAVLFGERGARPSLVAVVDLLDARVTEVVPAQQW